MPQFFPDGPSSVNLHNLQEMGGINLPPESVNEFDTPGMQGSMQQILSENLGKYIMADFLIGVSNIIRRVGILYSVGRGFVVLYNEDYHTFQVCDIFSLKFVAFFPPGFEPTMEDLLAGAYPSGILNPFDVRNTRIPTAGSQIGMASNTAGGVSGMAAGMSGMSGMSVNGGNPQTPASSAIRNSSGNGCRTLGQR